MNKELEKLNVLVESSCLLFARELAKPIKTALKKLERLEKEKQTEKKLKVLEIIKEKRVNLEYLKCCENYDQYKNICSYWNKITQQEFDLLKEVLNEK